MKVQKNFMLILVIATGLSIASCASKPKLYPNEAYKTRGKAIAEGDVKNCMAEADTYLESSEGKKIAKSAGFGAVVGGAVGAVAGAFSGDIARGAAQGAAMGGVGGGTAGAMTPDELKHRYVNQCLADKGYHVLGWD